MLHVKELLHIDARARTCTLTERATPANLEALATATIVATSHRLANPNPNPNPNPNLNP